MPGGNLYPCQLLERPMTLSGRVFLVRPIWTQKPLSRQASTGENLRSFLAFCLLYVIHGTAPVPMLSVFLGQRGVWILRIPFKTTITTNFCRAGSNLGPYKGYKELQAKRILKIIRGIFKSLGWYKRKVYLLALGLQTKFPGDDFFFGGGGV